MSVLGHNFATVTPRMSRFTNAGLAEYKHPAGDFSCFTKILHPFSCENQLRNACIWNNPIMFDIFFPIVPCPFRWLCGYM